METWGSRAAGDVPSSPGCWSCSSSPQVGTGRRWPPGSACWWPPVLSLVVLVVVLGELRVGGELSGVCLLLQKGSETQLRGWVAKRVLALEGVEIWEITGRERGWIPQGGPQRCCRGEPAWGSLGADGERRGKGPAPCRASPFIGGVNQQPRAPLSPPRLGPDREKVLLLVLSPRLVNCWGFVPNPARPSPRGPRGSLSAGRSSEAELLPHAGCWGQARTAAGLSSSPQTGGHPENQGGTQPPPPKRLQLCGVRALGTGTGTSRHHSGASQGRFQLGNAEAVFWGKARATALCLGQNTSGQLAATGGDRR